MMCLLRNLVGVSSKTSMLSKDPAHWPGSLMSPSRNGVPPLLNIARKKKVQDKSFSPCIYMVCGHSNSKKGKKNHFKFYTLSSKVVNER